jgi:hypothetical protein
MTDPITAQIMEVAPGWGCLLAAIIIAGREVRHWLQVHHKRIVLDFARTATAEQVATAKAMLEGGAAPALNRDPKPGNLPAALVPLLAVLALAGCAPTSAELLQGSLWDANAARACSLPGACAASESCIGSVVVLAAEGAGRAAVRQTASSCAAFTAPPAASMARAAAGAHLFDLGSLGGVSTAVDAISAAVAAQIAAASARAQERETTRKAVGAQAAHDLAVVQGRAAPGP